MLVLVLVNAGTSIYLYSIVKASNLDEKTDHFLTIFNKKSRKKGNFQKILPAYNDCISLSPVVEQNMRTKYERGQQHEKKAFSTNNG